MAERPISSQQLRTPISYERWLLQYRDGLDLDDPYHDTEFDTEAQHLEHAEYMLFGALRGSPHYSGPVSDDNPLIPSNVADVEVFYDAAVGLISALYTAAIAADRSEDGEPVSDLAVYAGCEQLQSVEDIIERDYLSGLVKSPFFVVGVAPEHGLLLFRDRLLLRELACRERAELRRVHERVSYGIRG